MACIKVIAIVCIFFQFVEINCVKKPDDISDEMYCLGCEATIKELDFMLRRKPTRGMGETVSRALMKLCEKNNFDKYDLDSKKVLKVCQHIKEEDAVEAILITDYNRMHNMGKQTTYLEMTEKICSTLLKACQKRNFMDSHGPEGGISYDPETAEFQITNGKKVRVARPVHSNGSSNNDKPQGNADKVTIETQPPAKSESTPEEHSHDHEEL